MAFTMVRGSHAPAVRDTGGCIGIVTGCPFGVVMYCGAYGETYGDT
jgi:hypothetical protein